jgi:FMNH2-dependent dimethyl sulfone monooxygenase
MQFGIYAPVPHVTVGSKTMLRSISGAMGPLPEGTVDPGFELAKEVLLEADRAGFDIILFAERHLGADLEAWVLACAISSWTQRIRAMVAVHPGLWHPELIAKMAASLDRITRGRMAINLVTGWNVEEHRMYGGDALVGDDDRYIRAEEFIEVVRGMWRETPYSRAGHYYPVEAAELRLRPATVQPPEIFTASRSERGLEMVAKIADWWFVDFDKTATTPDEYMEGVQRSIAGMRKRAERYGRKVRFALNPFIAFGDSDEAAVERAKRLLAPEPGDGDVRKLMQRIGPAMLSGCIGRPEKVRARLEAFADVGVELFLFKFVPSLDEVRAIRDEVIFPFRARAGASQLVEA